MSDYTPTTEQVLKQWVAEWAPSPNLEAQFHRWLAAHDAEIRADEAEHWAHTVIVYGKQGERIGRAAALAEQGETGWEYGNEQLLHSHVEVFPASSEAVARAQAWLYPIRRRRKAGPWLPVPDTVRDSDSHESEGKA